MAVSKQLLPVYDKPMIYYPLSALMLAGIREIAIITTPEDQRQFQRLLGDGGAMGPVASPISSQPSPDGLAQAYLLAEDFLAGAPSAMVLGDNIFFGHGLPELLAAADARTHGRHRLRLSRRRSRTLRRGRLRRRRPGPRDHREARASRPRTTPSPGSISSTAPRPSAPRKVTPSARGELEITTLLESYLADGQLAGRAHGPRLCLARHRHPRQPAGCRQFRAHAGGAAGPADRQPRRDRLCRRAGSAATSWTQRAAMFRKNAYGRYLERLLK